MPGKDAEQSGGFVQAPLRLGFGLGIADLLEVATERPKSRVPLLELGGVTQYLPRPISHLDVVVALPGGCQQFLGGPLVDSGILRQPSGQTGGVLCGGIETVLGDSKELQHRPDAADERGSPDIP